MTAAAIPLTDGVAVPGTAATQRARRAALDDLTAAGWPTRRREQWRYTDLEPLASAHFELTPGAPSAVDLEAVTRRLGEAALGDPAHRLVLLDGRLLEGHVAATLPEIDVGDPESRWPEFETKFARTISAPQHPLATLNTAFMQRGLWLKLRAGTKLAAPLHIVIVGSARARVASQPRVIVEAEEGAEATLVQHFIDCDGASSGWINAVTQIKQAAGSRLTLYRLQAHGAERTHTSLLTAELARDAEFNAVYLDLGARLVRNDIAVTLAARGARTDLRGLILAGAGQHIDDHTLIRHAAGETISNESVRGIIGERGRGVFNGKVVVERGCQRIDARQTNDNLLLGEHAEIDAKPELEIYADDVKCSHGATVGEIDAEQLFYLRARGLDASEARNLLTTAFAAVILEHVRDETLRGAFTEHVTARLGGLMEP